MAFFKPTYKKLSKLWYPQAITVDEPVTMDELCKQIELVSTVSKGDAKAVLATLGQVMGVFMNAGRSVRVEGLGTFYYTCTSEGKGKATKEEVDKSCITGTRVRFVPESTRQGNVITRSLISSDVTWRNIETISKLDGTGASGETPGTGGTDTGEDQGGSPIA